MKCSFIRKFFNHDVHFTAANAINTAFGDDTRGLTPDQRDERCENAAFHLSGEEDEALHVELTDDMPGPTLLHHAFLFRNSVADQRVGFMCFANRNFLIQIRGGRSTYIVTGAASQEEVAGGGEEQGEGEEQQQQQGGNSDDDHPYQRDDRLPNGHM